MSKPKYILFLKEKDYNHINVVIALLKSEGVDAVLLSRKDSMYYMPFMGHYEIHIPESQLDQAEEVLVNMSKNQ